MSRTLRDAAEGTYTRVVVSLIPISDANPTRRLPVLTLALIAINIVAYFLQPGGPVLFDEPDAATSRFFVEVAPIPCQLEDECPVDELQLVPDSPEAVDIPERSFSGFLWAVILSTFLHANLLHLGGNMLFLWVFGNNVEDYLRPIKFILFYLAGGIAAGFAQTLTNLGQPVPSIGASGAVAAILGAYMVLYPRARVNVLVPIVFIWTVLQLSAFIVLGLWFVYQFAVPQPGVAWQAHVGGFVFGVIAIFLLGGRPHRARPVWQPEWRY